MNSQATYSHKINANIFSRNSKSQSSSFNAASKNAIFKQNQPSKEINTPKTNSLKDQNKSKFSTPLKTKSQTPSNHFDNQDSKPSTDSQFNKETISEKPDQTSQLKTNASKKEIKTNSTKSDNDNQKKEIITIFTKSDNNNQEQSLLMSNKSIKEDDIDSPVEDLPINISNSLSKLRKARKIYENLIEDEENYLLSYYKQQVSNQNQMIILQQQQLQQQLQQQQQQQWFQMIQMNNSIQAQLNMKMMNQLQYQSKKKKRRNNK